jgi:hypothetical protein
MVDSRLLGNDQREGGNDGHAGSIGVRIALAWEVVRRGKVILWSPNELMFRALLHITFRRCI